MEQQFLERARKLVSQMTLGEKIAQMQHDAPAIERLGIPAYNWWNEGLHGVARAGCATVFPQAIGLAASFNEKLLYEVACAVSDEARAKYNAFRRLHGGDTKIYQGLTYWSPNINLFRDPRWGRGQETYGEDPLLTARMGTAFVRGLQGEHPVWRKVDATLKHYAVHSGPEGLRHGFDAKVGQEDLFESYLWAFRYCIRHADPSAVMGAYNRVNGEACCASPTLLQKILYGEFGFDGYVVSDCGAICDIAKNHHVTENDAQSAALAVKNGCQLNCGVAYQWLKAAVGMNLIDEDTITEAVVRLFAARMRLGMFDEACPYHDIPYEAVDSPKHQALNLKMAQESIVLLKNDGILPLKPDVHVAVIGPNADEKEVLLGNYNGIPSRWVTPLQGILQHSQGRVEYAPGSALSRSPGPSWDALRLDEALAAARQAQVIVVCMGLSPSIEGEEGDAQNDYYGDKRDLELPQVQKTLFEALRELGKPMVFVNISGSCINLSQQDRECNAVLQCFYPGALGGEALAQILYGQVSPSGRLPVTFYRSAQDLPPFEDYSMRSRTYRYYEGPVVYPFGHGLTYSKIEEHWLSPWKALVKNAGDYETDYCVLQFGRVNGHPQLCGFEKIHLMPGEEKTVFFPPEECPFEME